MRQFWDGAQESEFLTRAQVPRLLLVQRNRPGRVGSSTAKEKKPENSNRCYETLPTPPTYSALSCERSSSGGSRSHMYSGSLVLMGQAHKPPLPRDGLTPRLGFSVSNYLLLRLHRSWARTELVACGPATPLPPFFDLV